MCLLVLVYLAALGFEVGSMNCKSDALYRTVCALVLISYMKLGDVVLVQALGWTLIASWVCRRK